MVPIETVINSSQIIIFSFVGTKMETRDVWTNMKVYNILSLFAHRMLTLEKIGL